MTLKFLQITESGQPLKVPKLLLQGVDLDVISYWQLLKYPQEHPNISNTTTENHYTIGNMDVICFLADCYRQRPLYSVEIDGVEWCEFDIMTFNTNSVGLITFEHGCFGVSSNPGPFGYSAFCTVTFQDYKNKTNRGLIFTPENQAKYPELYQEALKIIRE